MLEGLFTLAEDHDRTWQRRKRLANTFDLLRYLSNPTVGGLRDTLSEAAMLGTSTCTVGAITQFRKKVGWGIFRRMLTNSYKIFRTNCKNRYLWYGHRIFAVDASRVNVPRALKGAKYRCPSKTAYYPQGMLSLLYDIKAKVPVHAEFCRHENERRPVAAHLKATDPGDIIVYDRGYLSFKLIELHFEQSRHFVMRLYKRTIRELTTTTLEAKNDVIVDIERPELRRKVRVVRFRVNGSVIAVATSLLDQSKYPRKAIKSLYAKRWGIEEAFKSLKQQLHLEKFHSKTPMGIKQEIFAKILRLFLMRIIEIPFCAESRQGRIRKPSRTAVRSGLSIYFPQITGDSCIVRIPNEEFFQASVAKNMLSYRLGRRFTRISHKPINRWKRKEKRPLRSARSSEALKRAP